MSLEAKLMVRELYYNLTSGSALYLTAVTCLIPDEEELRTFLHTHFTQLTLLMDRLPGISSMKSVKELIDEVIENANNNNSQLGQFTKMIQNAVEETRDDFAAISKSEWDEDVQD